MSKEEKIMTVLIKNEDSLSDGFHFYSSDCTQTLSIIAKEILKAIEKD